MTWLRVNGKRRFNFGNALGMAFLNVKDPATIKLLRVGMIQLGYKAHNFMHKLAQRLGLLQHKKHPLATVGKTSITTQVIHFINRPLPKTVPTKTARALMGLEDSQFIPVIRNPQSASAEHEAVFYFRVVDQNACFRR